MFIELFKLKDYRRLPLTDGKEFMKNLRKLEELAAKDGRKMGFQILIERKVGSPFMLENAVYEELDPRCGPGTGTKPKMPLPPPPPKKSKHDVFD